jgi:hypothetical protein
MFHRSFFYSAATPSDYFKGDILQQGKKVGQVTGSWLTHLDVDGERFYEYTMENAQIPKQVDQPLPSDCRYREDLLSLAKGDYEAAHQNKILLEQTQRNDRKLRAKYSGSPDMKTPTGSPTPN